MTLKDKVIIITGGGRGFGKALAETLAKEGSKIIICSKTEEELKFVCDEIVKNGGSCDYFIIDVSKRDEVENFVDKVVNLYGRIDVLINNAGWINEKKPVEKITDDEYERIFKTNVDSVFYFLRKVVPIMKQQNNGIIVNVSSGAGKRGHPGLSIYSATKFAVQGFTQSVAKELEDTNIRCIAICPGGMNTSMRKRIFGREDAEKQQSPEVVAEIVRDTLNGKILVPNGGDISIRNGKATEISGQ